VLNHISDSGVFWAENMIYKEKVIGNKESMNLEFTWFILILEELIVWSLT